MCFLPFIDADLALAIYRDALGPGLRSLAVDDAVAHCDDLETALETATRTGAGSW